MDEAKTAVVVDLPSPEARRSRGFEILYTLDRLDADNGLVDFVAPTEALVAQPTRRHRRDFDWIKRLGHRGTRAVFASRLRNAAAIAALQHQRAAGDDLSRGTYYRDRADAHEHGSA